MSPETFKKELRLELLAARGSIIDVAKRRGIITRTLVRLFGGLR